MLPLVPVVQEVVFQISEMRSKRLPMLMDIAQLKSTGVMVSEKSFTGLLLSR